MSSHKQPLPTGVRVRIIAPPHNTRRFLASGDIAGNQTGVITREGSSINGGWFEILLDGHTDKRVYYRRGALRRADGDASQPSRIRSSQHKSSSKHTSHQSSHSSHRIGQVGAISAFSVPSPRNASGTAPENVSSASLVSTAMVPSINTEASDSEDVDLAQDLRDVPSPAHSAPLSSVRPRGGVRRQSARLTPSSNDSPKNAMESDNDHDSDSSPPTPSPASYGKAASSSHDRRRLRKPMHPYRSILVAGNCSEFGAPTHFFFPALVSPSMSNTPPSSCGSSSSPSSQSICSIALPPVSSHAQSLTLTTTIRTPF